MAADLPAIAVAVCDLYQRLDRGAHWPVLDRRPHRLHDRLHQIRPAARPWLWNPGVCRHRALVWSDRHDPVADGARITVVPASVGRDRGTARATLGKGLAVSAFPLSVPV